MSMHSTLFEHEMIGTGRTLGRAHHVKVRFAGETAEATADTISFPAIPARELDDREVAIGRGYADHEAAHHRYTDFAFGQPHLAKAKSERAHIRMAAMQASEDVRIEALNNRDFPGSARNLSALANAVGEQTLPHLKTFLADPKADLRALAADAISWAGRKAMGNGSPGEQACLDALPKGVRDFAERAAKLALASTSTQESIDLSYKLDRILGAVRGDADSIEQAAKKLGQPGQGQGEAGAAGEGSSGDGQGQGQGEGKADAADKSDGGRKGEGEGGWGYVNAGHDESRIPEVKPWQPVTGAKVIEKAFASTAQQRAQGGYTVIDRSEDITYSADGKDGTRRAGNLARGMQADVRAAADRALAAMAGRNATMARKLELMLLDDKRSQWDAGRLDGRLNPRQLVRAGAFGAEDVFRKRIEAKQVEAAVSIVVDLSGSMSGEKATVARDACLLLAQALDRCGVPFEITGFMSGRKLDAYDRAVSSSRRGDRRDEGWGRICAHLEYAIKRWDDSFRQAKGVIHMTASLPGNSNTDADAVINATARLLKRPERKRIMLVMSDGRPAWLGTAPARPSGAGDANTDFTIEAVRMAEDRGVTVVGLGILTNAPRLIYPRFALVRAVADLAGETLDQIAKALLGDRATARKVA